MSTVGTHSRPRCSKSVHGILSSYAHNFMFCYCIRLKYFMEGTVWYVLLAYQFSGIYDQQKSHTTGVGFRVSIRNTNWVTFHAKINFAKTDFERTQRQTDLHSIIKSQLRADNGQRRRIYREPPILAERLTLLASPPLFSRGFHSAAASSLSRLKTACISATSYAFARNTGGGTCQTYPFGAFVVTEGLQVSN